MIHLLNRVLSPACSRWNLGRFFNSSVGRIGIVFSHPWHHWDALLCNQHLQGWEDQQHLCSHGNSEQDVGDFHFPSAVGWRSLGEGWEGR